MTVKIQRPIKFNNSCNCIVDYDELSKAIIWYSNTPVQSIKKIYIHGNYPAITIKRDKIHIHRLLMEYWLNTDIPKNFSVHHINKNKLDARKENLSVIYASAHTSEHNKGRIITEQQREITKISNHKRLGEKRGFYKKDISYKKIWKLYKQGYSINKISIILNYDWGQVKTRISEIYDNPELLEEE